ncbi:molybdopterin-dependent oxidoreductase [Streptomyces violascens]|uniref:molybdopterin-dependent oxidoreductase n=1 Tax=Streptomyces violascens TaxID=67381 RepID=UPI0036C06936
MHAERTDGNRDLTSHFSSARLEQSRARGIFPIASIPCCGPSLIGTNPSAAAEPAATDSPPRPAGGRPPHLICVDPRPTPAARRAAVHLAPRSGTNVALLNALLHEIIRTGRTDHDFITAHTVGFEELENQVAGCTPACAAAICDVPAAEIEHAADVLGSAERLLSTVLQGVYQSHQATAAAVQVNNMQLIRGMLGRPGCGVLQMNGQPSAQNTRECGANGDLPGGGGDLRPHIEVPYTPASASQGCGTAWSSCPSTTGTGTHPAAIARSDTTGRARWQGGRRTRPRSPTGRPPTERDLAPNPPSSSLTICRLYLAASENSLHWEMLAQLAQATKDDRLLELVSACHPQTLRQIRWANTMIKTLSPQALTST